MSSTFGAQASISRIAWEFYPNSSSWVIRFKKSAQSTVAEKVACFSATAFFRATKGRYTTVSRAGLAVTIFGKIDGKVEAIFGDS